MVFVKVGFLSDIHEDYTALCAAVDLLDRAQCDQLICLGDIVGFSFPYQRPYAQRNPESCIALIRDQCCAAVAGNHDLFAVRRVPRYTAGFDYGPDWYAHEEHVRSRKARKRLWGYEDFDLPQTLSTEAQEYLHTLPEYMTVEIDGSPLFISHFRYPDLSGSLVLSLRSDHLHEHFTFVRSRDCTLSFSGHGHPEGFARTVQNRLCFSGFGSHTLPRDEQWIVVPGVARSERASGVLAFDTRTFDLEAIALHVP